MVKYKSQEVFYYGKKRKETCTQSSNDRRKKEVLSITVGDNESSKYWLSVLNELKNRGVKDILIICADGLSGIKEAIAAAFPKTEYQRCIVHQVRNTLKYIPDKDRKAFSNWDAITPIFKFSPDVRKVIYTTNAIESLNSTYRKLNAYFQVIQRS